MLSYSLRIQGIPICWHTRIERWKPPFEFVDAQEKGPYRLWRHTHRFYEKDGGTSVEDQIDFALPFGVLGSLVYRLQVAGDLRKIFDYRDQRVHARFG